MVYETKDLSTYDGPLQRDEQARSRRLGIEKVSRSWLRRTTVGGALAIGDVLVLLTILHLGAFAFVPGSALILIGIFWAVGLYTGIGPSPFERLRLRTLGALAFCAIQICAFHAEMHMGGYIGVVIEFLLLVAFGHYTELIVRGWLEARGISGAPTVIVGTGPVAEKLFQTLASDLSLGLRPIGFLPLSAHSADAPPSQSPTQIRGISDPPTSRELAEVAVVASGNEIALGKHFSAPTGFERVLMAVDSEDLQSLYLRTRTLGCGIGLEISNATRLAHYSSVKRYLDLLICVPAAIFTLPLVIVLALVVKLIYQEFAFFVQSRVGREGRLFRVFKIRTMYGDAEHRLAGHLKAHPEARAEWERFVKLSDDPRILPVLGTFIRRWSLDELPQLWNVIRGDMSLVGPRPFPEYHTSCFDEHFRSLRASVLPGITGLWQVSSRSNGDLSVQRAQDLFYIHNQSFWLDLYIVLQTIPAILTAKGAK